MRIKNVVTAGMAVAFATSPIMATANETGNRISSSTGAAYVSRAGAMLPATAGMALKSGDRVITRGNGKVSLAGTCARTLGATSMMTVGAGSNCGATSTVAMSPAGMQSIDEDDETGTGGYLVGLLALGAAGLGLWAALSSGDDDDLPTFVPPVPVSP